MIVPMKKAQIVVLKEDYDAVIKSLQRFEVIMIVNKEGGDASPSLEFNESLQQRVQKTISLVKKYEPKKPLFGDYQVAEYDEFKSVSSESLELLNQIENLVIENENLEHVVKENEEIYNTLVAWKDLTDLPVDVKDTKYTRMHVGYIPPRYLESFQKEMLEEEFVYQVYGKNQHGYAVMAPCYFLDEDELQLLLKKYEFNECTLPRLTTTIGSYLEEIQKEIDLRKETINNNQQTIKELANRSDELRMLSDQILTQEQINNVSCEITKETKIIEGWVRSDLTTELEKAVKKATKIYDIELSDPTEDDHVPTYTKNNQFVSQFETITDMFSKPSIHDVDPNPVMSVWYWFLFGMMMGDAGYGLIMILGALLFKKIAKPKGGTRKLANIIMYSGVPTIFWGIMFGSYFGFNPSVDFGWKFVWYWFNPMDNPILMLIVSVAVGALHLITGLVIKSVICIKEKDYTELLSKNISWILILLGIGLFFVNKIVGIVCVGLGVVLILLFAGAHHKSIFGKAAFGLLGLYDATSYLGDVLSYSRIMALAMSSAAVAVVMNTLAQMVGGSIIGAFFAAIIFIVGHLFNVVLGLLSAYVHDARLQYIEFFGKFYIGGGIDFKPLSIKTKYVKEIKNIR